MRPENKMALFNICPCFEFKTFGGGSRASTQMKNENKNNILSHRNTGGLKIKI